MTTIAEAVEIRRVVLDMFEQGDLALALWLAAQEERALEVVQSVPSLVGRRLIKERWNNISWRAGRRAHGYVVLVALNCHAVVGVVHPLTVTIFARSTGNDETGEGTLLNPYATAARAIGVIPKVMPPDVRYVVDVGGSVGVWNNGATGNL